VICAATAQGFVRVAPRSADGPVHVTVQEGEGEARVRLNGRAVRLGPQVHGRRSVRLSAAHGLRHGRNTLRVVRTGPDGVRRRMVMRVRMSGRRPLAGARDLLVGAGTRVRLDGSPSRARFGGALSFRWRLVAAPVRSRQHSRRARLDGGRLVGGIRTGRTLGFVADAPGTYRFQLEVTEGSTRSFADPVHVTAVAPAPLVALRTNVFSRVGNDESRSAIRVGDQQYVAVAQNRPRSGSCAVEGAYPQVNLVVLDRRTLEFRRHDILCRERYKVDAAPGALRAILDGLSSDDLVIGQVLTWGGIQPTRALYDQLGRVGFGPVTGGANASVAGFVGTLGLAPGEAAINANAPFGSAGGGDLEGYLAWDISNRYTFVSNRRSTIDTRASGAGDGRVVVRVGERDYTSPADAGPGFVLVTLDRVALTAPGAVHHRSDTEAGLKALSAALAATSERQLVVLTSVGRVAAGLDEPSVAAAWDEVARRIGELGGTPEVLYAMRASDTYSAILRRGLGRAQAIEAASVVDRSSDGRVRGILTPDPQSRWGLDVASPAGPVRTPLVDVAFQAPGPWPLTDTPERRAALGYISRRVDSGNSNLRTSYWLSDPDLAVWASKQVQIGLLAPPEGEGFDASTFGEVRDQLVLELTLLIKVHSYINGLAEPFTSGALEGWAYLQAIAEEIERGIKAPAPGDVRPTGVNWARVVGEALALVDKVSGVPGAGQVVALYKVALAFARTQVGLPPGADADELVLRPGQVGLDYVARLRRSQTALRSLGRMVVGDWEKLRTVGALAGCGPQIPGCTPDWRLTPDDKDAAVRAFTTASRRTFYEALIPGRLQAAVVGLSTAKYQTSQGFGSFWGTASPPFPPVTPQDWACRARGEGKDGLSNVPAPTPPFPATEQNFFQTTFFPLRGVAESATGTIRTGSRMPPEQFGLISRVREDGKYLPMTGNVMATLFRPADPSDPGATGLGVSPLQFYSRTMTPVRKTCLEWQDS
jgi:hypothetical protein